MNYLAVQKWNKLKTLKRQVGHLGKSFNTIVVRESFYRCFDHFSYSARQKPFYVRQPAQKFSVKKSTIALECFPNVRRYCRSSYVCPKRNTFSASRDVYFFILLFILDYWHPILYHSQLRNASTVYSTTLHGEERSKHDLTYNVASNLLSFDILQILFIPVVVGVAILPNVNLVSAI